MPQLLAQQHLLLRCFAYLPSPVLCYFLSVGVVALQRKGALPFRQLLAGHGVARLLPTYFGRLKKQGKVNFHFAGKPAGLLAAELPGQLAPGLFHPSAPQLGRTHRGRVQGKKQARLMRGKQGVAQGLPQGIQGGQRIHRVRSQYIKSTARSVHHAGQRQFQSREQPPQYGFGEQVQIMRPSFQVLRRFGAGDVVQV